MQRWRGGVETDIAGNHLLRRQRIEGLGIGQLMDISALVEQAEQGGVVLGHGAAAVSMELAHWESTG